MDLDDITTQLYFSVVPLLTQKRDGRRRFGTAFIYTCRIEEDESIPMLVTARDVAGDAVGGMIGLAKDVSGLPAEEGRTVFKIGSRLLTTCVHESLNLAAIPLGPILNHLKERDIDVFYKAVTSNLMPDQSLRQRLSALEEVTFVGYPQGLFNKKSCTPLFGRGITASPFWEDYSEQGLFVIDACGHPCSQGSPVFTHEHGRDDRTVFLGMAAGPAGGSGKVPEDRNNLFTVVKSQEIESFLEDVLKEMMSGA